MSVRVEKGFFDLSQAMDQYGALTSTEVPYFVFGVTEEQDALDATLNAAPQTISNLELTGVEIDERINTDTFKVLAQYEVNSLYSSSSDSEAESSFAFDTAGGSKHISQSLQTILKVPSDAADFAGAIEVDSAGNVNGVDITMPVMNFSETHYLTASQVTTTYKKKLADLTGKINSSKFKGYDAGEVLFLGASGSRCGTNSSDKWEISFKFAVSINSIDLTIGDLTISEKSGWDYLWVRYENDLSTDEKNLIKKPIAAYVEQVYESRDFGELGIGN